MSEAMRHTLQLINANPDILPDYEAEARLGAGLPLWGSTPCAARGAGLPLRGTRRGPSREVLFTNSECSPDVAMSTVLDLFFNGNLPSLACPGGDPRGSGSARRYLGSC